MNKETCMIQSTRFKPTIKPELIEAETENGVIGVYNRGLSDMYDYLMDKFTKLYIHHMVADYEKPNIYVLMDFFNEFKKMIQEYDGHILEEELDEIMSGEDDGHE